MSTRDRDRYLREPPSYRFRDNFNYNSRDRVRNRNRNSGQSLSYVENIKDLLREQNQYLNNYFKRTILPNLTRERNFEKKNNDLKDIIGVFLWTFDRSISFQKQVLLLNNITQLIRDLNQNFSLNFLKLKISHSDDFYRRIIQDFIQNLNINREELEDMDFITDNFFYLLNIICDEVELENIFKRMNIRLTNQYMDLKRNSVIRKTRIQIKPNTIKHSFYQFMNEIFQNIYQINTRDERTPLSEEIKISIIHLISSIFMNQTDITYYVYEEYLKKRGLNKPIFFNLQKKLTNMTLRYYLPISYLLTDRRLKKYTQTEINTIIERVGERKGAQGFVNIDPETRIAQKYLNMRINRTPELGAGEEESTFYKVKEDKLKLSYSRINNTIPTIILIEYIIHTFLYRINPNYVSEILGISYTNNIAQIQYRLINGYNPSQLLSKPINRMNPDENKLIQFIFQGSERLGDRPLFNQWNRLKNSSSHFNFYQYLDSNKSKFMIPESFHFPQIRNIYRMIFQIMREYQHRLNFIHSDFGFGNMMFDKDKIQRSPSGEYISFQEGFIKLVDFELSSIFIPFDQTKPSEKYLIKKVENNYSTIVRNFVENANINPVGIKIYDLTRLILLGLVQNIYKRELVNIIPTEFIYTILQHFGRPYLQIQYKDLLKRFHSLFLTVEHKKDALKYLSQTISINYIIRNYVFFGIIPDGYTSENVLSHLIRYFTNGDLYFRRENFVLPSIEERPRDIIPGHPTVTFSDLFTPEYLINSFSPSNA